MNVMYDINPNAVKASMDSYDLARVIPLEGLNKKLGKGTRLEGYSYSIGYWVLLIGILCRLKLSHLCVNLYNSRIISNYLLNGGKWND